MKRTSCFTLILTIIITFTLTLGSYASQLVSEGSVFGASSNAHVYAGRIVLGDECAYVAGYTKADSLDGTEAGYGYGYNYNGLLLKYSLETEGEYEWAAIFGTTNADYAYGVDVDEEGNILVSGTTKGSGGDKYYGNGMDVMLAKFNSEGSNLWQRSWGSSSDEAAYHVAVDSSNNAYVVGGTYGSFHNQTDNTYNSDIFVSKVCSDGSNVWSKIWGSEYSTNVNKVSLSPYDAAWDVDVDDSNNVYIAGQTEGDILDGQTNMYGYAAFLTKMDADGNKVWTRLWTPEGSTTNTYNAAVGVAADDDMIAIIGVTTGGTNETDGLDSFIAVFCPDGTQLWSQTWGTTNLDHAKDVVIENSIYVAGYTKTLTDGQETDSTSINLGYGYAATTVAPNWNAFVCEFDPIDEALVWSKIWGSTNSDYAMGIEIDDAGNLYVSGYTDGSFHEYESTGLNVSFVTLWEWLDNAADFDGDGADDLTIYDPATGQWYIYSSGDDTVLQWATSVGVAGGEAITGDFNGDGTNDLAVYDTTDGYWYIQSIGGETISDGIQWGWEGAETVHGDFDGDGTDDLAVYDTSNGYWYIASLRQGVLAWQELWGWAGAQPVPGDYDGDGRDDLAVFDTENGYWYIISTRGTLILWQQMWGWPGAQPVAGDYDGDGVDDLAVYDTSYGYWYAMSARGNLIMWGQMWGWPGAEPIAGDYDGDGIDDLTVFDTSSGLWYSMTADGTEVIHWAKQWGWSGATAVTVN